MTKKEYRTDDTPPSEMFEDALYGVGFGNSETTCGWCGRHHMCPDAESYLGDDDGGVGWKKYCEDELKDNPEGTVLHYDDDCVISRELNGIMFVIGCPCNGLHRYEKFIWENRNTIRNYLKARIEKEYEWAEQELTKNKLAGISNPRLERFFKEDPAEIIS